MLWNIALHFVKMCCYNGFNEQAERPIAEQDNFRQEIQTEMQKEQEMIVLC